jgi:protein phosphatase 1 regulatory subunit 7
MISGLEGLVSLKRLDLSHNKIRKLENLDHLTDLEMLDVRGNMIQDMTDLKILSTVSETEIMDVVALSFYLSRNTSSVK